MLDKTSELDDDKYIQLVCLINELRSELFSALAMIGVEIPMTEREVAPPEATVVTKKRGKPHPLDHLRKTQVAPPVTTENPFAGNGFGTGW